MRAELRMVRRETVAHLDRANRTEHLSHKRVYRPWGYYESVDAGGRYVEDHCAAIREVLARGRPGGRPTTSAATRSATPSRSFGCFARCSSTPSRERAARHEDLIQFVKDRPGHDRRYVMNTEKIEAEPGWRTRERFESGLAKTVRRYLDNAEWVRAVKSGEYRGWVAKNYGRREGGD